jgi:hypothetical protein
MPPKKQRPDLSRKLGSVIDGRDSAGAGAGDQVEEERPLLPLIFDENGNPIFTVKDSSGKYIRLQANAALGPSITWTAITTATTSTSTTSATTTTTTITTTSSSGAPTVVTGAFGSGSGMRKNRPEARSRVKKLIPSVATESPLQPSAYTRRTADGTEPQIWESNLKGAINTPDMRLARFRSIYGANLLQQQKFTPISDAEESAIRDNVVNCLANPDPKISPDVLLQLLLWFAVLDSRTDAAKIESLVLRMFEIDPATGNFKWRYCSGDCRAFVNRNLTTVPVIPIDRRQCYCCTFRKIEIVHALYAYGGNERQGVVRAMKVLTQKKGTATMADAGASSSSTTMPRRYASNEVRRWFNNESALEYPDDGAADAEETRGITMIRLRQTRILRVYGVYTRRYGLIHFQPEPSHGSWQYRVLLRGGWHPTLTLLTLLCQVFLCPAKLKLPNDAPGHDLAIACLRQMSSKSPIFRQEREVNAKKTEKQKEEEKEHSDEAKIGARLFVCILSDMCTNPSQYDLLRLQEALDCIMVHIPLNHAWIVDALRTHSIDAYNIDHLPMDRLWMILAYFTAPDQQRVLQQAPTGAQRLDGANAYTTLLRDILSHAFRIEPRAVLKIRNTDKRFDDNAPQEGTAQFYFLKFHLDANRVPLPEHALRDDHDGNEKEEERDTGNGDEGDGEEDDEEGYVTSGDDEDDGEGADERNEELKRKGVEFYEEFYSRMGYGPAVPAAKEEHMNADANTSETLLGSEGSDATRDREDDRKTGDVKMHDTGSAEGKDNDDEEEPDEETIAPTAASTSVTAGTGQTKITLSTAARDNDDDDEENYITTLMLRARSGIANEGTSHVTGRNATGSTAVSAVSTGAEMPGIDSEERDSSDSEDENAEGPDASVHSRKRKDSSLGSAKGGVKRPSSIPESTRLELG